jgi:hypothetical protein
VRRPSGDITSFHRKKTAILSFCPPLATILSKTNAFARQRAIATNVIAGQEPHSRFFTVVGAWPCNSSGVTAKSLK